MVSLLLRGSSVSAVRIHVRVRVFPWICSFFGLFVRFLRDPPRGAASPASTAFDGDKCTRMFFFRFDSFFSENISACSFYPSCLPCLLPSFYRSDLADLASPSCLFCRKNRKNAKNAVFSRFEVSFSARFHNTLDCNLLCRRFSCGKWPFLAFFPFFWLSDLFFLQNGCIVSLFSDGWKTRRPKHAPFRGDCDTSS